MSWLRKTKHKSNKVRFSVELDVIACETLSREIAKHIHIEPLKRAIISHTNNICISVPKKESKLTKLLRRFGL